jgi:hypothetical protein
MHLARVGSSQLNWWRTFVVATMVSGWHTSTFLLLRLCRRFFFALGWKPGLLSTRDAGVGVKIRVISRMARGARTKPMQYPQLYWSFLIGQATWGLRVSFRFMVWSEYFAGVEVFGWEVPFSPVEVKCCEYGSFFVTVIHPWMVSLPTWQESTCVFWHSFFEGRFLVHLILLYSLPIL